MDPDSIDSNILHLRHAIQLLNIAKESSDQISCNIRRVVNILLKNAEYKEVPEVVEAAEVAEVVEAEVAEEKPLHIPPLPESVAGDSHSVASSARTATSARKRKLKFGRVLEIDESLIASASASTPGPACNFDNTDNTTDLTSSSIKRDFNLWVADLGILPGHIFYFGTDTFKLGMTKEGKASLTASTSNQKTVVGFSPSGAIKAFLKASGLIRDVDGWKRLTMYTEEGRIVNIGWEGWLQRRWDSSLNSFVLK